jgi:hypothetical protein
LPIEGTESLLRREFRSLAVAREQFPMVTDWGVEDFSETIHSLGMNYLTSIGKAGGRIAVSEYPIRLFTGQSGPAEVPAFVGPDVVWWDRVSRRIQLIGEFERCEVNLVRRQALTEKVRNLLLAHRAIGVEPRILLLMLWALSGTQIQAVSEFQSLIRSGFRSPGGVRVAGLDPESRLVVGTAIFAESGGCLRLKEILL